MARRNLISEYIAEHPENTVWTPENGWQNAHTTCGHPVPAWHETTWGTHGNVFCSLACMTAWSVPTDTVSQHELEETIR